MAPASSELDTAHNAALDQAIKEIQEAWKLKTMMGYNSMAQRNLVQQHINILMKLKKEI